MSDACLADEEGRIAALGRMEALDTAPEAPFEKVVSLIQTVLRVPMAAVTLVDRHRQWFKAQRGLTVSETPRDVSFCTHTIRQREPLVVAEARDDPRFADSPLVTGAPFIRSYAGVPLRTPDGYNVGALCAIDTQPRAFSEGDIAILRSFGSIVVDELELRLIARRDHLTGALTRRGFVEQAEKEIARFARSGRSGALALLDIDHFKSVNDTYGHAAGDRVLQQLAELCSATMRPSDELGRIGGEEFALLLPDTDPAQAFQAADRFRSVVAAYPFDIGEGRTLAVTASFGVAPLEFAITGVDRWLAIADEWLYRAKAAGRNRCLPDLRDRAG